MLNEADDSRRDDLLDRRSFVGIAALLPFMLARPSRGETAAQVGSVEDLKGQAFAEKDAVRRELDRAAALFVRDQVGTGADSRLTMRLGRDTTLKLGERARVTIDRYLVDAGGEINLGSGGMLFERPAHSTPSKVQIRSAFGLIAVRGTRFFAGPSNDVFGVFVEQGRVTVSAAGKSVTVRAGQGTDISHPGAAPTTPHPWREPRIRAALASVS
jgi:ferric-dicitrate binding protein FerR (iron transport regulator)